MLTPRLRVSRAGGDERRHGACLGNAFFENLAVLGFVVIEQRLAIDGLVELSLGRVNTDLAEQRIHAEGPRFVGNDRHDAFADLLVTQQLGQDSHGRHGGRHRMVARTFEEFRIIDRFRNSQRASP